MATTEDSVAIVRVMIERINTYIPAEHRDAMLAHLEDIAPPAVWSKATKN